jgi:hypothetical protein
MKSKKKQTTKESSPEKVNEDSINKLKRKMKNQKKALNKILKNIQNEKES